jgi:hypothetical protein
VVKHIAPDYIQEKDGKTFVDLVNTAARGLQEELGLELTGNDLKAICLTTVHLKFDTHEWELCGFVDLKDERIKPEHRISADSLKDLFSTSNQQTFSRPFLVCNLVSKHLSQHQRYICPERPFQFFAHGAEIKTSVVYLDLRLSRQQHGVRMCY